MKKVLLLALSIALTLSLVACGKKENDSKDALQRIKDKGTLVIATSPDYPPFEFLKMKDGKEEVAGFEIEAAREAAKELGVKLEIKQMGFDGILAAVKSGQVDIGVAGFTPTEDRKKEFNFSELVYSGKQTFIVNKKNADKIKTAEDLKGKKIGAQIGSIQANIAKTVGAGNVKELQDMGALVLDVVNGNLDAVIISQLSGEEYAKKQPKISLSEYEFTKGAEGTAFAYAKSKDNDSLLKEIDKIIKSLKSSGKLDQFFNEAKEQAAQ